MVEPLACTAHGCTAAGGNTPKLPLDLLFREGELHTTASATRPIARECAAILAAFLFRIMPSVIDDDASPTKQEQMLEREPDDEYALIFSCETAKRGLRPRPVAVN